MDQPRSSRTSDAFLREGPAPLLAHTQPNVSNSSVNLNIMESTRTRRVRVMGFTPLLAHNLGVVLVRYIMSSVAGSFMFDSRKRVTGFTILYAVLISSLLLSIGASIFNISLKQVILSTSASDSITALYTAEAGVECALYWDKKILFQGTAYLPPGVVSPPTYCNYGPQNPNGIPISELDGTLEEDPPGSGIWVSTFQMNLDPNLSLSPCAYVTVTKTPLAAGGYSTKIHSRGQNSCDEDTSKRVERAFEYTY